MSGPYKTFRADPKMEREGIWLDYGDYQIRIARAGGSNTEFAKAIERLTKPHRASIRNEVLDTEVAKKIMVEAYAETVIIEWKGITDENGVPMEFNKDNIVKLFTDLPDLFADVQEQAQKMALFRRETLELAAKNS